ncbi:hypothetical protein ACH4NF_35790 [Streptomyces sp. NPDC017248]|uniref:hypothetical protein n=1 Tax=unclassified Streptomyces TaxID=2593676 RepID=UPI0037BB6DF5
MNGSNNDEDQPEQNSPLTRLRLRLLEWRVHQHLVRGMAYGLGSGAVSLLILWARTR